MGSDFHLPTRRSLITRLKNWDDQESWREFFQIYWKLIYSMALKSGLTESEAEDAVQETVVTVARTMSKYRYDPERARFKTWLMRITRMRIVDQLRKREPGFRDRPRDGHPGDGTAAEERIPEPTKPFIETLWDEEWTRNLVDAAMDRVKSRVKPTHFQIFYLGVVKELETAEVARTLGVSAAQVYLVKHRVAALVKREIQRIEATADSGLLPGSP